MQISDVRVNQMFGCKLDVALDSYFLKLDQLSEANKLVSVFFLLWPFNVHVNQSVKK